MTDLLSYIQVHRQQTEAQLIQDCWWSPEKEVVWRMSDHGGRNEGS